MIEPTELSNHVNPVQFLNQAIKAVSTSDIEFLLGQLPITPEDEYIFNEDDPEAGWRQGFYHWLPVGGERGNAGRIKQANQPVNPIADRAINGMEAIIEMARQRELAANDSAVAPFSPRNAVQRYFSLPPLDELPKLDESEPSKIVRTKARELARQLRVRLVFDKPTREFTIAIEDDGIGQTQRGFIVRSCLSAQQRKLTNGI